MCLAKVLGDDVGVPKPNVILESSRKKYQFIWFVKDFTGETQEALNEALVAKFGLTKPAPIGPCAALSGASTH